MFPIRFDTTLQLRNVTDEHTHTDRQTPHDVIGYDYASHSAAKIIFQAVVIVVHVNVNHQFTGWAKSNEAS